MDGGCAPLIIDRFGKNRVFNTPLCEQGIVGFELAQQANGKPSYCRNPICRLYLSCFRSGMLVPVPFLQ
ncbi:hypothetical protein Leryth_000599 [Lithospermum erythrorhizon]|nr:hypothetical protein Leryth_000599 [Lithospermum erythrorhizon]